MGMLPWFPDLVGSPYDSTVEGYTNCPPPGAKFSVYQQLIYFYTNHPDTWLPASVVADLLAETETLQNSVSRLAFLPLSEDSGLMAWAAGPDLRTLGN